MRKIVFMGFLLFLGLSTALGQTIRISGKVTDSQTGDPVSFATVLVKGTTDGAVADMDGNYSVPAASNAALVVSAVGFTTQEVAIQNRNIVNIALEPDAVGLDEFVVVGYGVQKRSTFTGSATTVRSEKIERVPVTSVEKALQGNMPGVQITAASGQPGSNSQVLMRGVGSFSAGTAPLYVIDGVPMATGDFSILSSTTNAISHINPSDIESVTVLKDASATSIYGSRASNGVILITTKQGSEGKTSFQFRSQLGVSQRTNAHFKVLTADEFVMLTNEGRANAGLAPQNFGDYPNFDWLAASFRDDALTQNYEMSASGGTNKTRFFVSAGIFDQEGMAIGSRLLRYTGRANLDHQATDKFSFGLNATYSNTYQDTPLTDAAYFTSPVTGAFLIPSIYSAYKEDGSYNMDYPALGGVNFIANIDYNDNESFANRLISSAYAQYKILKNLILKTNFGLDWLDLLEEFYDDPRAKGNTAFGKGRATAAMVKNTILTTSTTINYSEVFSRFHNLDFLLGHEAQASDYKDFTVSAEDFASFQLRRLSSGATPFETSGSGTGWRLYSFFSRLNYNYDNKYYFSGSLRRDGSSRFGKDNRYANFWSVGGSWRMSQESFIKDNFKFVDNFQFRGSIGTAGNSSIGNFAALGLYGYGTDYNGSPGSAPTQFENPDLRWEKNQNWNLGLDFRFFDRISGTIEYYERITSDLLLNVPLSSTAGIANMLRNIGKMKNHGWELSLAWDIFEPRSDFNINIGGNISFNTNRIVELVGGEDILAGLQIRREGESFLSWYLRRWAGVNPTNGAPMWYDADGNLTSIYTQADRQIVGKADPDFFGGLNATVSYKGFSLAAMFTFVYGNHLFDDTNRILNSDGAFTGFNQGAHQLDRWTTPGQVTDTPKRIHGNASQSNQASTRNLYDGSYLRLRNLTASYNLPSNPLKRVGISSTRVFVQGQNLLTWTNYPGMDPEQNLNGNVWFVYPNAKTITMGLELTF